MTKVKLAVNGNDILLNAFTQEIIGNVVIAMAESLRGVGEDWGQISIEVEND
jgi:hypothetical protein